MSKKEARPETVEQWVYWLRRTAPRDTVVGAFDQASWFHREKKGECLNASSPLFAFRRALGDMEPVLTKAYDKHLKLEAAARDADGTRFRLPTYDIEAEIAERFMTYVQAEYDRLNAPASVSGKR